MGAIVAWRDQTVNVRGGFRASWRAAVSGQIRSDSSRSDAIAGTGSQSEAAMGRGRLSAGEEFD
jgi:hypothetical protein